MPKVSINLLRWNTSWEEVHKCMRAVLQSDFSDYLLFYTENADPGAPTLVAQVAREFGDHPKVRIVNNERNLGYAGGHNRFFAETDSELLMVLNPDAILQPDFLECIVRVFDDATVGAATGKMIKPRQRPDDPVVLDGTGIVMAPSRRARERGQFEIDRRQYDRDLEVFGVSGTAAVYRKAALERARLGQQEYFDTDFFAYWEDLDLSWRIRLQGFRCVYVPGAVLEHARAASSTPEGVRRFRSYLSNQRQLSIAIRKWNWRNHVFMIVKNDGGSSFFRNLPVIFARELGVLAVSVALAPRTLSVVPEFFRLLPRMLRKRRVIQRNRVRDSGGVDRLLQRNA